MALYKSYVLLLLLLYWVFSVPEHIIFTNFPKNPFRSITILHFLADFAVPETIIFKISLISTRSSPPTACSARMQSVRQRRGFAAVPEIRIISLKTDQARSGDSHFHAQNGSSSLTGAPHFQAQNSSSSFRSPTFSRSTGSPFRSPCPLFTLPRHITTKIWGEYPPPPRVIFSQNRSSCAWHNVINALPCAWHNVATPLA